MVKLLIPNYQDSNIWLLEVISIMFAFLSEVRSELEKVTFPSKNELIRLTAIVIAISVIVGVFSGAADYLFIKILEVIIK